MAELDIEDRIMNLEKTTAVHTVQIDLVNRGFERLSESLDGLTESLTKFTNGCTSEQSRFTTELKWLERGVLFILACLLTSELDKFIM